METLVRRRAGRYVARPAKRGRGDRVKARSRLSQESPRRAKPKGASGERRAKPTCDRKGLLGGENPETAARCAGSLLRQCDDQREKW